MWVSENSVPLNPMVLLIIIPMKNGHFIGNINPTFSDKPMSRNPTKFVKKQHNATRHEGVDLQTSGGLPGAAMSSLRRIRFWRAIASSGRRNENGFDIAKVGLVLKCWSSCIYIYMCVCVLIYLFIDLHIIYKYIVYIHVGYCM